VNGLTPWYKTTPKIQPDEFPVNYPVPDFGMEENIIETKKSIALEEKKIKAYDENRLVQNICSTTKKLLCARLWS